MMISPAQNIVQQNSLKSSAKQIGAVAVLTARLPWSSAPACRPEHVRISADRGSLLLGAHRRTGFQALHFPWLSQHAVVAVPARRHFAPDAGAATDVEQRGGVGGQWRQARRAQWTCVLRASETSANTASRFHLTTALPRTSAGEPEWESESEAGAVDLPHVHPDMGASELQQARSALGPSSCHVWTLWG